MSFVYGGLASHVRLLSWNDVDPDQHVFDPSAADAIIDRAAQNARATNSDVTASVDRALVHELGPWAAGRQCAKQDGGVVRSADPRQGLREWRAFIEACQSRYAEIRSEHGARAVADHAYHAAHMLLPLVVEATHTEDAWYETYTLALGWYLEHLGLPPRQAHVLVEELIDGRFSSWTEPKPPTVEGVATNIGLRTEAQLSKTSDALATWRRRRNVKEFVWVPSSHTPRPIAPVAHDAHRAYIDTVDAPRGEPRAKALHEALSLVRAAARAKRVLDWQMLVRWQRVVLQVPEGQALGLRAGEAFAHGGQERYGSIELREWQAIIGSWRDPELSVAGRATLAYLDVCFFHPFDDGNARLARLVLDYWLTHQRMALHAAGPVFRLTRRASRSYELRSIVEYLVGPTTKPLR